MDYKLFQLNRDFWIRNSMEEILKRDKIKVNLDNYVLAYEGKIEQEGDNLPLGDLFYKFNMDCPHDFEGRSMSVSDIVMLGDKYYFCDSIGWEEVNPHAEKKEGIVTILDEEEELVLYYKVPSRSEKRIYENKIESIEEAEQLFRSMSDDEEVTDILIVKKVIKKEVLFRK